MPRHQLAQQVRNLFRRDYERYLIYYILQSLGLFTSHHQPRLDENHRY